MKIWTPIPKQSKCLLMAAPFQMPPGGGGMALKERLPGLDPIPTRASRTR